MPLNERYILLTVAKPALIALGIGVGFLIAVRFSLAVEFGFNQADPFSSIFQTILYWVPFYLGLAIPVSVFCGMMLGLQRMAHSSELVVMQACGFTPGALLRPMFILTILATLAAVFIYGWLDPLTTYARRVFNHQAQHSAFLFSVEKQAFIKLGNSVVFIDDLNRKTGEFKQVFIYNELDDRRTQTITAPKGVLLAQKEIGARPKLVLNDVSIFNMNEPGSESSGSKNNLFSKSRAKSIEHIVGPKLSKFRNRGHDHKELTLFQLIFSDKERYSEYRTQKIYSEIHFRFAEILFVSFLPFLVLSFVSQVNIRRINYSFLLGLVTLAMTYQVIVYGNIVSGSKGWSPLIVIWFPLITILSAAMFRCYRIFVKPA